VQSAQHRLRPRASGRGAAAVRTLSVVVVVCVALAGGRGAAAVRTLSVVVVVCVALAGGRGAVVVRTLSVVVVVCVALARGRGAVVVLVRAVSVATAIVAVDSTPQPQWLSRLALLLANLRRQRPTSHTIVEAHPDVLARMARDGWPERYTIPTILWLY
jgi:hypothetical protein